MLYNSEIEALLTDRTTRKIKLPTVIIFQGGSIKGIPTLIFSSPSGNAQIVIHNWGDRGSISIRIENKATKVKRFFTSLDEVISPFKEYIEKVLLEYKHWKRNGEQTDEEKEEEIDKSKAEIQSIVDTF